MVSCHACADAPADGFREAVWTGLGQTAKQLPCKYLYDETGARLFTRICRLPEYYLTRTEMAILRQYGPAIASSLPPAAAIVEFGSGTSRKIDLLLPHIEGAAAYVPIDVSATCLQAVERRIRASFPHVAVSPVHADFTRPLQLSAALASGPRVGFFPGSTLGNFDPVEAVALLRRFAATLGAGGRLVIGVDVRKDVRVLQAAYNDAAGVTAAFNLNLLRRINRELGGDFDLSGFAHRAPFNRARGRIEMHLVSVRAQTVHVAGRAFTFRCGESIHTENSYKLTRGQFADLVGEAGLSIVRSWTDRGGHFDVHLLRG